MKRVLLFSIAILLAVSTRAAEINVFAAASLTDALKQIAGDYETAAGDKIVFNFAASGTLARQIAAGAPADIFFSADEGKMDELAARNLVAADSRTNLLGNSLVIVAPQNNVTVHSPADLTNAAVRRIALGDVKNVPAGVYTKNYLEKLRLWPAVEAKVVPCENVRAVLAAVESGNVDAGVVYKTDSALSAKVEVVFAVPVDDGPKIVYPVALLKESPHPDAARRFLAYLESDTATEVFEKFGFITVKRPPK